jgi:heat shock protein HslJ
MIRHKRYTHTAAGALVFAALMAACTTWPPPPRAPAQALTTQIVNIVWQWAYLVETNPPAQLDVPDPQNYTLTFLEDGTVSIKADCNQVGGTYTLNGDKLTITLGASTMAFCGEDSLDQQFLESLSKVDAAGASDDSLVLYLTQDIVSMGFNPGGPAQTQAQTGAGSGASAGMIQPDQVSIDTQDLPDRWQAKLVPPTPYDASQPPDPMGLPEHIEISFSAADPGAQTPGDPIMYIIPVDAYEALWGDAGNATVSATINSIYTFTVALPAPAPLSGLPALPPEQISGVNDLVVQLGRVEPNSDSASKNGYRFVGRWAQDANPVTNGNLRYVYQGFTNDGRYLVAFYYPVTTSQLPDATSAEELAKFTANPQDYIAAQAEMLNELAASDWQPDLAALDAVVASLRIQGMPETGLHGAVWQWTGSTYQGKTTPVDDPAQYEVIYGLDGALRIKADCNNASGTYTFDGGMTGSVRTNIGPMTMAACADGSRSDEFVASLQAAQDFRIPPGGGQLQLNMPASGPVLNFSKRDQ